MPSVPTPSKAGIIQDESGDRHIPSSTRADGSKRKEIKIRPGYKPPEDVEVYKNRTAEGFRTRGKGGVPGADGLKDNEADSTPASNKNAKRREARRKATEAAASQSSEGSKLATGALAKDNWRQADDKQDKAEEVVDPEVEREKKARNLKKKLKQAKELKEKKEGGAALLPEQFAKVIKISELIRELDALGLDSEGEPKEKSEGKQEIKPDA